MNRKSPAFPAVVMLALTVFCGAAGAQESYPNRPIRLIIPYAPGGIFDYVARLVSPKLSESLRQMVVVDNRPGGGGMIAAAIASKAIADGYTILLVDPSFVINPNLQKALPYEPRDLTAVIVFTTASLVLSVNPAKVPAKSVPELVRLARTRKLSYGSAGVGTTPHMAGELFKIVTKVDMLHVPYKGAGPAAGAVVAGEVELVFGSVASTQGYIQGGRLRGLATTGAKRASAMSDLPTVAESGFPGFEVSVWSTAFVPAGTPRNIIERLNSEFRKVLRDPEVTSGLDKAAIEPLGSSPPEATAFVQNELKKWRELIRTAGIKVD
ncbi:MAG: tripartite tricarboxylate transporter substrate binding protein [Burkholderiales bacterium]|nr:tripartite tricarboxylate transporter substrate binding protein [Burkholderiales bacterium]